MASQGWNKDQWDVEREESQQIPLSAKNAAYFASLHLKTPIRMTMLGVKPEDDVDVYSDEIKDEIEYNQAQRKLLKDNKINPTGQYVYFCDDCEEGNYFWCRHRHYGDRLSCPEYEVHKGKGDAQEVVIPISETMSKGPSSPIRDHMATKPTPWSGSPPKPVGFAPQATTKPPTVTASTTSTKIPWDVEFRCMFCWHWFKDESQLASHITWCCPGRDGNTPETLHMVIKCLCRDCHTHEDRLVSKKPEEEETPTDTAKPAQATLGNDQVTDPDSDGKE